MPLTIYGLRVWLPMSTVAIALISISMFVGWMWAALPIAIIWLALLSFFRDPIRRVPHNLPPGAMLSPADGVVTAVLDLPQHEITSGQPAKLIRIFLSVLNVHVNRSPYAGEVIALKCTPGQFLNAQREESAAVNESNLITLQIADGAGGAETIGVRQVAGMLARTIVCPLKPGDRLKRGQKFGMIMFGSTTELILPRPGDTIVHVKKGDKVRGGLTVLATLQPRHKVV